MGEDEDDGGVGAATGAGGREDRRDCPIAPHADPTPPIAFAEAAVDGAEDDRDGVRGVPHVAAPSPPRRSPRRSDCGGGGRGSAGQPQGAQVLPPSGGGRGGGG